MGTRVLVVCTGNICRSPMAEVLMRDYAMRRGRDMEVRSASVMGLNGKPAHRHAQSVVKEIQLDLRSHRAQPVTRELMDWSDYVLGMELNHATTLRDRYPDKDDQLLLLGTFGGYVEIADPLGGWKHKFRNTRDQLTRCVASFVDQLPVDR